MSKQYIKTYEPLLEKIFDQYFNIFELLLHAGQGLWSPSRMQELWSFHLVEPNSGGVMMIVMSDMWDVKKMFGIIM